MLVQLRAGLSEHPSVYELGLCNRTEADGLAVPRASLLAAGLMRERLAGIYTETDDALFAHLARAHAAEALRLEPSAAAGLAGPLRLVRSAAGRAWLAEQGLLSQLPQATHLVWTTGGALLPDAEFAQFLERGKAIIQRQAQGEPHDNH